MRLSFVRKLPALCAIACLPLSLSSVAAAPEPTASIWKLQEIRYSYTGFTTSYSCESAESRIKSVLLAVGAHPSTKVQAIGCEANRPSRNFFVTITTATPAPVADHKPSQADKSKQELLDRLGVKNPVSSEEFPATWKSVDISGDRKLDLQPGDCELMSGIRDHVLPKLAVKIESDRVRCTPKSLSIKTPELKVSALTKLESADTPAEGR